MITIYFNGRSPHYGNDLISMLDYAARLEARFGFIMTKITDHDGVEFNHNQIEELLTSQIASHEVQAQRFKIMLGRYTG